MMWQVKAPRTARCPDKVRMNFAPSSVVQPVTDEITAGPQ